jgi:hypothetical protein
MARVDADRGQPLCRQRMVEPHRQRPRLEHDPPGIRCALVDQSCEQLRVRHALASPDPLAVLPDRTCRLFHVHGYVEIDAWAPVSIVSPFFILAGDSQSARAPNIAAKLWWPPLPRLRHVRSRAQVGRFGDIRISRRTFLDSLGRSEEVPAQSSAGAASRSGLRTLERNTLETKRPDDPSGGRIFVFHLKARNVRTRARGRTIALPQIPCGQLRRSRQRRPLAES